MNPFFSLVIPAYNDGRYAEGVYLDRLLTSVEQQGLEKDEIEIIVVNDCSPCPISSFIERHPSLNVRVFTLLENKGQGNAREQGAAVAKGQWLCFADHDDLFYPGAFKAVKKCIEQTGESLIVFTAFNKVDNDDLSLVIEEFRDPNLYTWIHGKFYNIPNLWKQCNIHFIPDLRTHEDIALGNTIKCALHSLHLSPDTHTYLPEPTYMWVSNPASISNSEYVSKTDSNNVNHSFNELGFENLVKATTEPYFVAYMQNQLAASDAVILVITELCQLWYQMAAFKANSPEHYLKVNEAYCSRLLHRIKDAFSVSLAQIKVWCQFYLKDFKEKIDNAAPRTAGMLPLFDWLDMLNSMNYEQVIVAETGKGVMTSINESETASDSRPFFSIVIACYNDGRYKKGVYLDRLLASITRQSLPKQCIEVILADDCSPVPFDDIVSDYVDRLTIKRVKTDYNFAPGNTRAKGVEVVTGQWLCFADHDDLFYDGALYKIKDAITKEAEKYYAFGDFYGVDPQGRVTRKFEKMMNWCHGKFYNVDNLWKPFNIHFIHDLKSHEDIAICTQVACALQSLRLTKLTYFHFPVYAWTDNPESVSHSKYTIDVQSGQREFLEVFFEDYISSTGRIYLDMFKIHKVSIVYAVKSVLEVMLYCYFYTQAFQFKRPKDYFKGNLKYAGQFVADCKKTFNLTNESIYQAIASNGAAMYLNIRPQADPGCGHYMPVQTFKDWLKLIEKHSKS